jgi:predicted phosphoribosyltransferase
LAVDFKLFRSKNDLDVLFARGLDVPNRKALLQEIAALLEPKNWACEQSLERVAAMLKRNVEGELEHALTEIGKAQRRQQISNPLQPRVQEELLPADQFCDSLAITEAN